MAHQLAAVWFYPFNRRALALRVTVLAYVDPMASTDAPPDLVLMHKVAPGTRDAVQGYDVAGREVLYYLEEDVRAKRRNGVGRARHVREGREILAGNDTVGLLHIKEV